MYEPANVVAGATGPEAGSVAVALRVRLRPRPGVGDHRLDLRLARDPPELVADPLGRGHERGCVARAAGLLADGDLAAGDGACRLDHLAHREPGAVAEVVELVLAGGRRALEPEDVRLA